MEKITAKPMDMDYKENKMKQILLIILLLISVDVFAQFAAPTYTDYLRLRKYAQGDNPSADSLNANWTGLDNWADGVAELDSANTFSAIQTFNGANFAAGAHGTVTLSDSVVIPGLLRSKKYDPYDATSTMGSSSNPMNQVWARSFYSPNQYGNDSVGFSYGDSTLTFTGNISMPSLTITESIMLDSGTVFNSFILGIDSHSPITVADTIATIDEVSPPLINLVLPGSMTTGISRLVIKPGSAGQIIVLRNGTVPYTYKLNDYIGNDDNLMLSADFTMGYNDTIVLMCIVEDPQTWIEISRSNN